MTTRDDLLYEVLVLWRAYQCVYERFTGCDARTGSPGELVGAVARHGHARAAAGLFADAHTDNLADGADLLDELLELARAGRRPRYARELGDAFCAELLGNLTTNASSPEGASS